MASRLMKKAIIDLGTNTFNLLIGTIEDGKFSIDYATKEIVLLGMNGINDGIIAPDAMVRAIEALGKFKLICDQQKVQTITGFGTSAMRSAKNARDLIKVTQKSLGFPIYVISGQEEATLIYRGVSLLHDFKQPGVIMDIGGGSNEYIHANESGVIAAKSFDIGVSRIFQLLGSPEELPNDIQEKIGQIFETETNGFFDNLNSSLLIGASGSFETFYEMIFSMPFPKEDRTFPLPMAALYEQIDWVLKSTLEERIAHPWITPIRKKMLPIAAYSIRWTMEKLQTKEVTICPYSLKEGALLS